MSRPLIQVLFDETDLTPPVSRALQLIGAESQLSTLKDSTNTGDVRPFDARLILTGDVARLSNGKLDTLLRTVDRNPCATLIVTDSASNLGVTPRNLFDERGISVVTRATSDELASRLTTMCTLRRQMSSLRGEVDRLKQRDHLLNHDLTRLKSDLQTASVLQKRLMRAPNAPIRGADLHTVYIPVDSVSGDSYRVVRLDKDHVSICICDATGHGLAAALLTEFVQRSISSVEQMHGVELFDQPDIVLRTVNAAILRADLENCDFVAMLYAVYNESTNVIRWARGGTPHPVIIDEESGARQLTGGGPALGVIAEADFKTQQTTISKGSSFLIHSDGLELTAIAPNNSQDVRSSMINAHAASSIHLAQALARLQQSGMTLQPQADQQDDITLLLMSR